MYTSESLVSLQCEKLTKTPFLIISLFQDQTEHNSSIIKSQTNTAVIRGLKPGGIYVFQVRARTVAGFGRYSGKMYFQTMTEGEYGLKIFIISSDLVFMRINYMHMIQPIILTSPTSYKSKHVCN